MSNFNPQEHMQDIKGKPYLPVQWRLVWVREEHPDWTIVTEIVKLEEKMAIVRASIADENNRILATAHKMETQSGFFDFLEKAETGSVGRALAMCGYGTQFSPDLEEGERLADSPVEVKKPLEAKNKPLKATKPQVNMFFAVGAQKGYEQEELKEMAKKKYKLESFNDISKTQISEAISGLTKLPDAPQEDVDPDEIPEDIFDGKVDGQQ